MYVAKGVSNGQLEVVGDDGMTLWFRMPSVDAPYQIDGNQLAITHANGQVAVYNIDDGPNGQVSWR